MTRITLLTDFGTADGYVAAMKGVISTIAPEAVIDDASHDIPPGDVFAASMTLSRYWRLYPPGTIHVVVVDPGVGTDRRAVAARIDDRLFVAPDNGILTRVLAEGQEADVVVLESSAHRREEVSATFHGRDIFAPAAAHLARGVPLHKLGGPVSDLVRLRLPEPTRGPLGVEGEIVHVDRFGNLITNVPGTWVAPESRIIVAGVEITSLGRTYADVEPGAALALTGSTGMLEISVRDGSAAESLAAGRGARVIVRRGVR